MLGLSQRWRRCEKRALCAVFESRFVDRHASTIAIFLPLFILVLSVIKIGAEPNTSHSVQSRVYWAIKETLDPPVRAWVERATTHGQSFMTLPSAWRSYKGNRPALPAGTFDKNYRGIDKLVEIGEGWSLVPELGYGIIRRLDDASFWTLIAIVLAFTALRDKAQSVRPLVRSAPLGVMRTGALIALSLLTIYVLEMAWTGGTFFFWLRSDLSTYWTAPWGSLRLFVIGVEQVLAGC